MRIHAELDATAYKQLHFHVLIFLWPGGISLFFIFFRSNFIFLNSFLRWFCRFMACNSSLVIGIVVLVYEHAVVVLRACCCSTLIWHSCAKLRCLHTIFICTNISMCVYKLQLYKYVHTCVYTHESVWEFRFWRTKSVSMCAYAFYYAVSHIRSYSFLPLYSSTFFARHITACIYVYLSRLYIIAICQA